MKGIDPRRLAWRGPAVLLAGSLVMAQARADTPALLPPVDGAQSVADVSSATADTPGAAASPPEGQRVWSQAPTVQDLVRLDLEAALAQRRGHHPAVGVAPGAGMPPTTGKPESGGLRLTAIYGVGRQLQAELFSEGRRVVLRMGGAGALSQGLRLIAIEGECVRVRPRDEAVRSVCLTRAEAS